MRITEDRHFAVPEDSDFISLGTECLRCGVLVQRAEKAMEVHKTWHLKLDALAAHLTDGFVESI